MSQSRHEERQQRLKKKRGCTIEAAQIERYRYCLYWKWKGKTTAAFGTVCRAVAMVKKPLLFNLLRWLG
ncbi:hypothetical protein J4727_06360 [Providencia rettgeri]|uniref:Uncharacterized protein n=1 Tax=Providencia rettgeri TaxID=587 RepID=A0A939NEB1_PRORE|nr:hypothetical protein [Providencia rettgeri]